MHVGALSETQVKIQMQSFFLNAYTKRNYKTKKSHKNSTLTIFSANAAGLNSKGHSLKHQIKQCNATIFTIQETNYKKKGRLNIEEFEVFEAIRKKKKDGGGTLVGTHKSLEPVLIEEYSDSFELIVGEVKVNEKEVRVISGYGPHECWPDEEKMPFL